MASRKNARATRVPGRRASTSAPVSTTVQRERQHAPWEGDGNEMDRRLASVAPAFVGERDAQVAPFGRCRVGARHEAERSDAAQIGAADVQHAIANRQSAVRGPCRARPEAADGREPVGVGRGRYVHAHPRELAAGDLLQMQRRAGNPERKQERQQHGIGCPQSAHSLLPVD